MLNSAKESSTRTAVIAGLADTLITLGALIASQSAVVMADFLKTVLEFVAVLLAWMAIRRITRGAGATYEYGIGKLENLVSLLMAIVMMACAVAISRTTRRIARRAAGPSERARISTSGPRTEKAIPSASSRKSSDPPGPCRAG